VAFDDELAAELKKRAEQAQSSSETSESASASSGQPKPDEPLSSPEEAKRLSEQLTPWVFEVRKFQIDKLRFKRDGLVEKLQPQSAANSSSPSDAAKAKPKK
jgi:hypothetical protein